MKKFLHVLLPVVLAFSAASCDKLDPEPEPKEIQCLETLEVSDAGYSYERTYENGILTELHDSYNGDRLSTDYFEYNGSGQIIARDRFNYQADRFSPKAEFTYNGMGKLSEWKSTSTAGDVTTVLYTYDSQRNLKKMVSTTTKTDGTVVANYTADFEWQNGNNTLFTYKTSTQQSVRAYTFDTQFENKRKNEQEKLAFNYITVQYNKNMYKSQRLTTTNLSTGEETVMDFDYEYAYDDNKYPIHLVVNRTSSSGAPVVTSYDYSYNCD